MGELSLRKDLQLLKRVCNVGKIFAIVPFYDFEKSSFVHPTLNAFYAIAVLIFLTFGAVASIYSRYNYTYTLQSIVNVLQDNINEFFATMLTIFVICGSNFSHRTKWAKLMEKFELVDGNLKIIYRNRVEYFRNTYLYFGWIHFLLLICDFYIYYELVKLISLPVIFQDVFVPKICYLFEIFIKFLVYNLTKTLKRNYEDVNTFLKITTESQKFNSFKIVDKAESIRKFEGLIRNLANIAGLINEIFAWPLFFIISRSVIDILTSMNDIQHGLGKSQIDFAISSLLRMLLFLLSSFWTLISFSAVVGESKKTLFLCHKLQEKFPTDSEERTELRRLAKFANYNAPKFTAAGFFNIDRGTLFSILGTAVTYFIIGYQFSLNSGKS